MTGIHIDNATHFPTGKLNTESKGWVCPKCNIGVSPKLDTCPRCSIKHFFDPIAGDRGPWPDGQSSNDLWTSAEKDKI